MPGLPWHPAGLVRLSAGLGASRSCTGWSSLIPSLDGSICAPAAEEGNATGAGRVGKAEERDGITALAGMARTRCYIPISFYSSFFFSSILYIFTLERPAKHSNLAPLQLLDVFGEHGPSVRGITSFVFFSDLFLDESVLIVRVLHSIHSLSLLELYHMVGHVPYISVPNNSFYRRMEY